VLPNISTYEEALGTGRSEIRNRVLAPIFKDLGLIESWGTGIQRIRREVEEHGNVRLVLQEVGNAFQVQFVKTVENRNRAGPS